mgnify:FL=1
MEELVDIFTKDGYKTGISMPRETAIKEGKLIKAFQIWILNNNNQVLMEIRSNGKLHDAGMLDLCSGHVRQGERESQAVRREIKEELGENAIKTREFEKIIKVGSERCDFRKYGRPGNYIFPWYILKLDRKIPEEDFELQKEEVAAIQWMDYEKVKEIIKSGSNNIRIPYLPQTKNLLQKLDEIIYERGQERWEEKL